MGKHPVVLTVLPHRKLQVQGVDSPHLPVGIRKQAAQTFAFALREATFAEFFIPLVLDAGRRETRTMSVRIASQILWRVSDIFETKICAPFSSFSIAGVPRELKPLASDVSVGEISLSTIWDKSNWRQGARELWRYRQASLQAFPQKPLFVALAGPDCTKVGTDLSISMCMVFNPVNQLASVGPPQVPTRTSNLRKSTPENQASER